MTASKHAVSQMEAGSQRCPNFQAGSSTRRAGRWRLARRGNSTPFCSTEKCTPTEESLLSIVSDSRTPPGRNYCFRPLACASYSPPTLNTTKWSAIRPQVEFPNAYLQSVVKFLAVFHERTC